MGRFEAKEACIGHLTILRWPGAAIFGNMKAWLAGTHHGVSPKHLPRYLREWQYRFNRRDLTGGPALWLIRRVVEWATITYEQIVEGDLPNCAIRDRRNPTRAVAKCFTWIGGVSKI